MSNFEPPFPASSSLSAAQLPAVCIPDLGPIGGSTMRDLRVHNVGCFSWNRSSTTVEEATKKGFDAGTSLQATLERVEASRTLIVIGTPMTAVGTMLDAINGHVPSCGITDVVSVKAAAAAEVFACGIGECFVSAYLMTSPAQAGRSAAPGGLFDGAPWVVTYDLAAAVDAAGKPVLERWVEVFSQVTNLGAAPGSQLIPVSSDHHDADVVRISHVPHLVAYAIAVVGEADDPLAISLAAGSFRDCTRVVAAAPDMAMSRCENNTEPVLAVLDDVIERLTAAHTQLATEGTAMDLVKIGQITRVRYEARPVHRPILRLRVDEGDWINQLKLTESVGG